MPELRTPVNLRDGTPVLDPRLGRIPQFDAASRRFTVRAHLDAKAPRKVRYQRPGTVTLDQGWYGACVLASRAHADNASPVRRKPPYPFDPWALNHYFEVQRIDPWPGGEYPGASPYEGGTSILTLMRYGRSLGWWEGYRWVGAGSGTVADDIWDTLRYVNNVQLGIPWHESMYDPTPGGLLIVDPASTLFGYHAISAIAGRYAAIPGHGPKKVEHAVLHQTWGRWGTTYYGISGMCFLPITDLAEKLMPNYGEGAVTFRTMT
jgi:hypothetical protein